MYRVDVGKQVTPRTAAITLHWRPTPRVYDARAALLTLLEEQKRLRAFRVQDEDARALIDDDLEVVIAVRHFSVASAAGFPEGAVIKSLFDSVLDIVKPRISSVTARFQHLCTLPAASGFTQAKIDVARAVLGPLAPELNLADFAILCDGTRSEKFASYRAEFGVVDTPEAVHRLTQSIGQLNSDDEPDFSHIAWDEKNLPEVALYIDSRWRNEQALSSTSSDALYLCAKSYAEGSNEVVQALLERVGVELPEG